MSETICQLCGQKRECEPTLCDTTHLHPKAGKKLRGHKGRARLSVCVNCEKEYGGKK